MKINFYYTFKNGDYAKVDIKEIKEFKMKNKEFDGRPCSEILTKIDIFNIYNKGVFERCPMPLYKNIYCVGCPRNRIITDGTHYGIDFKL